MRKSRALRTPIATLRNIKALVLSVKERGFGFVFRKGVSFVSHFVLHNIVQRTSALWERLGLYVAEIHFYQPVPDVRELKQRKDIWENESTLIGIEINVSRQLDFVRRVFPSFEKEYRFPVQQTNVPFEFFIGNDTFGPVDAEVAHSMVRHFLPRKIIEIGSGRSTYLLARACLLNKEKSGIETELLVVNPCPNATLLRGFPGLSSVRQEKCENVELDFFLQLSAGDILFIDSTHVVKTGGDVNYLYLEVLPRLASGVNVHVHDIFLPREYPREWVLKSRRYFSEQYLLRAFLLFNYAFEVLWCGSYMHLHYPLELKAAFPSYDNTAIGLAVSGCKRRPS